ncbi:hypothetical protein L207DRAFT_98691 [Hyaloscypha variabilis F]|jgi:hypothetical protein|uniref:Uncharacterized protein n=1 Tax=Hyaloscypha variabilis (strain UAMH 11265 / GT02V1 / F) TaxID=1149755 RepID=A0A2J6RBU0_HYAVF|nr:hypothetical protein L207DRAFT_98691 [Hyaloscypha variabilis F]
MKARWLLQGCGGEPVQLTWSLYSLIERALKAGPVGRRTHKSDRKISIKEFIIDVKTPNPDSPLNPTYLLNSIISDIKTLLRMRYDTAKYGTLLYERIGKIKVLMDGELHKEWNLAKQLVKVPLDGLFGNYAQLGRQALFARWKQSVLQSRVELEVDLPIVSPEKGKRGGNRSSASSADSSLLVSRR